MSRKNALQSSVGELPARHFAGKERTIFATECPLAADDSLVLETANFGPDSGSILGRDDFRNRQLQDLLPRISEHRCSGGIHIEIVPLRVGNENTIGRLFH